MELIRSCSANEVVEVIEKNAGLLLVHFTSTLASSSEFVKKELELIAPLFEGSLAIVEVEMPLQDLGLIKSYRLEEIPTLILFNGSDEVERFEAIRLPEELKELLEAAVSFY